MSLQETIRDLADESAKKLCRIDECVKPRQGRRTLCSMHYERIRKHGTSEPGSGTHGTVEERFLRRVIKSDEGCWEWPGSVDSGGYGQIGVGGRLISTHRLSWQIHNGPIPPAMEVMHTCDNPPCTNPAHLKIGDHRTNMADAWAKKRLRPPLMQGSAHPEAKLTEDKVRVIRELRGSGQTLLAIATHFGIDQSTVERIANRKAWKHVS